MGTFKTRLRVWNPANPQRVEEVEAIVDTGACPGFGKGTYNAFLWKHRRGNGNTAELFELVGPNSFKRLRK